jgi:hypothetical protein
MTDEEMSVNKLSKSDADYVYDLIFTFFDP